MRQIDRNTQTFCARKFHSMLLTASVSMGMEYLMPVSYTHLTLPTKA